MIKFGLEQPDRTAFSMNVSPSGAFLRTNSIFKPGTTIQVELHFPDRKVTHWARVVWAKKVPPQLAHLLTCGMGIEFINPGEEWAGFFADWSAKVS